MWLEEVLKYVVRSTEMRRNMKSPKLEWPNQ